MLKINIKKDITSAFIPVGETEKDFNVMKEWAAEQKFDRLGAFTYSHEENTHAHKLNDDVPAEVKQQRAEAIMDIQSNISYDKNQEKIVYVYSTENKYSVIAFICLNQYDISFWFKWEQYV